MRTMFSFAKKSLWQLSTRPGARYFGSADLYAGRAAVLNILIRSLSAAAMLFDSRHDAMQAGGLYPGMVVA